MTPILIVLALLALGVGIVVWATRGKRTPAAPAQGESDTAWNDPVTPAEPARPLHRDETPPPAEPRV